MKLSRRSVPAAVERLARAAVSRADNHGLRAALDADVAPAAALFRALLAVAYRVAVLDEAAARRDAPAPAHATWEALVAAISVDGALGALGLPPAPSGDDAPPTLLAALIAVNLQDADVAAFVETLRTRDEDDAPLGAVHEAMLACEPTLVAGALTVTAAGRGRRASGSFYTPDALVGWLLDAALEPALDEAALDGAALDAASAPRDALLALRVCDPSCGAGAFLEPAARRVAARLAADAPSEARPRREAAALRDVVTHCIYGVDLDPLAVFACQATLWLATLGPDTSPGAAHTVAAALAAHVRRGDALLGADAALVNAGVPDLAFVAHPGDDRVLATSWRARNRSERRALAKGAGTKGVLSGTADAHLTATLDAWCAAFFWPRTAAAPPPPTTGSLQAPSELLLVRPSEPTRALAARLAAVHGFFHWDTAFPEARGGFHVMLGNPPFLNQLEADTVSSRPAAALLRARFPDEVGAYTDTAALLLLHAARRLRPGGRLAMVQPQSILAAQDARAVRAALVAVAPPTHVWWSGAHVFPGTSVYVTALALRRGPPVPALVRAHGITFAPLPPRDLDVDALATADTWAPLVADALGAPPLALRTRGTLGDLADATADFRDEYYGLVPHVVDRAEADERRYPRLVLTGHVDPGRSWWGARPVRFGKRAWDAPRVDLAALERDGALTAWAAARRVPKVLVATQTKVLEAVADPEGTWLTTTPTISVLPRDAAHLWRVAAVLLGPPASAWALTHYGATALAAGALKLSARQVQAIPLPVHEAPWAEAAAHVAEAHARHDPAEARALLLLAGAAMVRAYEGDDALVAWWRARLPAVG